MALLKKTTLDNLGTQTGQASYLRVAARGIEEPLSTHSDHYNYNGAYGAAAYGKGATWMSMMGYVIEKNTRQRTH